MEFQNVTELITLDGSSLLAQFQVNKLYGSPICLDVDLIKSVSQYSESALLYQIRQVLQKDFSQDLFKETLLFVDFWEFFQHVDTNRNDLFTELLKKGFSAKLADSDETVHYVPFEKSQSQAKDCVISFIREDLFLPVRKRLDLDIGFGDYAGGNAPEGFPLQEGVTQLSKLYAYRGLYLTEAVRVEGIEELLDPDRIVILNESPIRLSATTQDSNVSMYTARKVCMTKDGKKAILEGVSNEKADTPYEFDPFDGVGLISPRGAALLNRAMDPKGFSASQIDPQHTDPQELLLNGMAVSFQFRLPFCKGMLHTVDFHRFFREESGLPEDCWVEDAFGIMRNLKNADIILNQTLFKLCGLLKPELKQNPAKKPLLIQHYFNKVKEYHHSIYIVKTDREQRRTGYTRLTAQIINTLPFTQEAFDRLVKRHTERAEQHRLANILLSEGKLPVLEEDSGENVHKYIDAHYCLALDGYVESLIDSCRKQELHSLYLGKLEVEGDTRFLSRDLIYYLHRIGKLCGATKKFDLIPRGALYLPGEPEGRQCAVFRSPHLCPNENVLAVTAQETDLRKRYLGHLRRVVFVGAFSQMPDALGGADFDGDMVVIAFQKEVVEACQKNCYREDGAGLPLIRIPSLSPAVSTDPLKHLQNADCHYVDVKTIQNTFNSQIGMISNATMKICAAEAVSDKELPYPSKFCAILNGVEIDAAKTGIRPDLKEVVAFASYPNSGKKISEKATQAMCLVGTYLNVRNDLKNRDLTAISITEDEKNYLVKYGKQEITKFSKEAADKPYVYQLLCRWAEAFKGTASTENAAADTQQTQKEQAIRKLRELLQQTASDGKKPGFSNNQRNYPRDEVLKRLVFCCPERVSRQHSDAVAAVMQAYTTVRNAVDAVQKSNDPAGYEAIRRKLIYLLQYKYDDVDRAAADQPTIRQRGNVLSKQLGLHLQNSGDIADTLEDAFYCTRQPCDPWLFRTEQARQDWLSSLLDSQTAQITADFGCHGYDLLFYALRELQKRANAADLRQALRAQTGDAFLDTLYAAAADAVAQGYSSTQISSRLLPRLCREKLEELSGETDPNVLIPLVYGCTKSADRPIVWKLFSWPEIEAYLKKVHGNAE